MSVKSLKKKAQEIPQSIEKYCTALGWDTKVLKSGLYSVGLSDENLYLEDPNNSVLSVIAEFLTFSGSSIFVVYAENGMGKTALKEFTMRTFADDGRFSSFSIDHPGPLTEFALSALILHNLTDTKKHPTSTALVLEAIESHLITAREAGVTTLLWVDEGQKLKPGQLEILRSLADIKTPEGDLTCKILIAGTLDLKERVDAWVRGPAIDDTKADEARAFDDRCGFTTMHLKRWSKEHILAWWQLLADGANIKKEPATNPFDASTASTILDASEGKPRSIVQLTQMAIATRAKICFDDPRASWKITPDDVESAIDARLDGAI